MKLLFYVIIPAANKPFITAMERVLLIHYKWLAGI